MQFWKDQMCFLALNFMWLSPLHLNFWELKHVVWGSLSQEMFIVWIKIWHSFIKHTKVIVRKKIHLNLRGSGGIFFKISWFHIEWPIRWFSSFPSYCLKWSISTPALLSVPLLSTALFPGVTLSCWAVLHCFSSSYATKLSRVCCFFGVVLFGASYLTSSFLCPLLILLSSPVFLVFSKVLPAFSYPTSLQQSTVFQCHPLQLLLQFVNL